MLESGSQYSIRRMMDKIRAFLWLHLGIGSWYDAISYVGLLTLAVVIFWNA